MNSAEEMLACEKKWHKQCFKCTLPGCGRVLAKGGYLEKDGMPYEQLYLFIKIPNSTFYFSDLLCMNNKAIVVDRHYTPCFYPSWLHIRARPCHHQRTVPDPHLPLFTLFFLFFFYSKRYCEKPCFAQVSGVGGISAGGGGGAGIGHGAAGEVAEK